MLEAFVLNQLGNEIKEFSNDQKAVMAQRVLLAKQIREAKAQYKLKVEEHTGKLQNFVVAKLNEELKAVKIREQALAESKTQNARKLNEHRKVLNEQAADRVNKLEAFVIKQLSEEINEFKQDKDALVEMRVKMASEAKSKLDEAKKAFVERASKIVESTVENQLRKEMTQLKEDIRTSRENIFGRRLFEAFQVEYMTSYLSEGTQVKKLTNKLTEVQKKLDEASKALSTQKQLNEQAQRKVALSEEKATRVKTLNELLRPLNREKREVMENLLETVKTSSLKEAFQKYLPAVLNETVKDNKGRRVLSEAAPLQEKRTIAVTGNRTNRLVESTHTEETQDQSAEIVNLRRLAGIEK
jgi:DNA repair exonuclease SbcCD ATPase subunit